jgi:hypothetical protein
MSEVVSFPAFKQPRRERLPSVVEMTDYGRRESPRFFVHFHEVDGGWSSYEHIGDRHVDALATIDRVKRERGNIEAIYSNARGR